MIFTIGNCCRTCATTIRHSVKFKSGLNPPTRLNNNRVVTTNRFPDYEVIYKFPLIRIASIVNKLKFYQIVGTGVGLSGATILAALDIVTPDIVATFALSGISFCLTFCAIGFLGHNRVGFIYMKNDQSTIKISYTDFWGRRVDTDVDVQDMWPLSDLPTSVLNPFYYNLRRYSTNQKFKFNLKYGIIVDPIKFTQVFGDIKLVTKN